MILTCPDCATRYFVDDGKIAPEGRTVRCNACGTRWSAKPEGDVELELTNSPELGAVAEPAATPQPEVKAEEPVGSLSRQFRAKVEEKRSVRQAVVQGAVWASIAAAFLLTIALSVLFRVEVVSLLPRTASAYAAVGLPVNPLGLTFENISAQPALQDGYAALVVSGAVRNVEDGDATSPALEIRILGEHGEILGSETHALEDAHVPAGGVRHFVIPVLNPPADAVDVEVAFARTRASHAPEAHDDHGAAADESHEPVLRGSILEPEADGHHAPEAVADDHGEPAYAEPAHAEEEPHAEPAHAEAEEHGAEHHG